MEASMLSPDRLSDSTSLATAAAEIFASAGFILVGTTPILITVVAGEDASAIGTNSRLRAHAAGRASLATTTDVAPDS